MWYVIQTQTGREQELTECIERVLKGNGYQACFVIEQECVWRNAGKLLAYQKPLFPSYVIADTDTPEEFFLALKRVPKLSKLLRTDCDFLAIQEEEKKLLCQMMELNELKSSEPEVLIVKKTTKFDSGIALKNVEIATNTVSMQSENAGAQDDKQKIILRPTLVRRSVVTLDKAGNILNAQGPLALFQDKIVRKRIRKRIVTVEVKLLGETRRIELGIRLPEDN